MTNYWSRLEVIMQMLSIKGKSISLTDVMKDLATNTKQFGLRRFFEDKNYGSQTRSYL